MAEELNTPTDALGDGYAGLRQLDRLVGTWRIQGPDVEGEVSYTWLEGGYFLIQSVDLLQAGHHTTGIEIIGYERPFGATAPGTDIRSRYFDNNGNTFDYTYEIDGDTLTIWGGERNSPAFYRGTFSPDGERNAGAWTYPGGGGYESTMTRVAPSHTSADDLDGSTVR